MLAENGTTGVYKVIQNAKKSLDIAKDAKTIAKGVVGAYHFAKTKDVDALRNVYEALKLGVEQTGLGKLLMKYYSTGFELFLQLAKDSQNADRITAELDEIMKQLNELRIYMDAVVRSTACDAHKFSLGPFSYMAQLQRQNPGVPNEPLFHVVQFTLKQALYLIRLYDAIIANATPLIDNAEMILKATDDELGKAKGIFARYKANHLVLESLDISSVSSSLGNLKTVRNDWLKWQGKPGPKPNKG